MGDPQVAKVLKAKQAMDSVEVGETAVFEEPLNGSDVSLLWKMFLGTEKAWRMQVGEFPDGKSYWYRIVNDPETVSATRYR